MLNKQNLIKYFENGIKSNANLKIGTEHEKFILNKDTFLPLKYDEENGINNIFLSLIDLGWKPKYSLDQGLKKTYKDFLSNMKN